MNMPKSMDIDGAPIKGSGMAQLLDQMSPGMYSTNLYVI